MSKSTLTFKDSDRLARDVAAFSEHESHPDPGVLVAYHARRLSDEDSEALQEHLAECEHCASLVLDLTELRGPTRRPKAWFGQSGWLKAAAMVLMSASIFGLGHWTGETGAKMEAKRPQAVTHKRTLLDLESLRGGAGDTVPEIQLPAELSFRFSSEARKSFVVFQFLDQDGRRLWEVDGGQVPADNEIQLFVSAGTLSPGLYRVQARVPGALKGDGVAMYHFRVVSP